MQSWIAQRDPLWFLPPSYSFTQNLFWTSSCTSPARTEKPGWHSASEQNFSPTVPKFTHTYTHTHTHTHTHTQGLPIELNTQVQNASPGLGKHSSRAVWVPRHLRLISCKNKGVPQFPWAAGHECEDSWVSEGEEVISSSHYSSHLMPQQCFTRQAVSATSPTQLLSAVPSPAAPCGCALPAPCGFCLLLSLWASGPPPQLVLSCLCSPGKASLGSAGPSAFWSTCLSGSSLQNPHSPLCALRASWQMTSLNSSTDFLNYSVTTKRTVPGTE